MSDNSDPYPVVAPGLCPTCGTDLDQDEICVGTDWFEAFCCVCSRYVRKRRHVSDNSVS